MQRIPLANNVNNWLTVHQLCPLQQTDMLTPLTWIPRKLNLGQLSLPSVRGR